MMSRKLAVALVLSAAMLGTAPAAANGGRDRVPAPIPVPAPMPIQESFSYYIRADLGWGFAGDPSFSESGAVYGTPPGVALTGRTVGTTDVLHGSIGAGAYWSPRFRTDITLDFRGTQSVDAAATYTDGPVQGVARDFIELRGTVGLFNAYWDLAPRGVFSPYVGAGIGLVYNQIDRAHVTTDDSGGAQPVVTGSSSSSSLGLAGALMLGVSYSWSHSWVLDIGYRALYMDGGDVVTTLSGTGGTSRVEIGSQWEHQVRVGLRANLW